MKTISYFRAALLVFVTQCLISGSVLAEDIKPKFKVTAPQTKQLIVEEIYTFRLMQYDPSVAIQFVHEPKAASYQTAEDTVIAHFSAMNAGDYSWFMETWSKESRKQMEQRNKSAQRTPEFWKKTWARVLQGGTVELLNRLESGPYVLIEYRLSAKGNEKPFQDTVALAREDGRWVLTQELAADPVLSSWNAPGLRVQRLVR